MQKKPLLFTALLFVFTPLHQASALTDKTKALLKSAIGAVLTIGGGYGYFFGGSPPQLSNEERYLFYSTRDDEHFGRLSADERRRLTGLLLGGNYQCGNDGRITNIESGREVPRWSLEHEADLAFTYGDGDTLGLYELRSGTCLALGVSGFWLFVSGLNDWLNLPREENPEEIEQN